MNKVFRKTVDLQQRFSLLRHVKQIKIRSVFQLSPITFYLFALSLNSIQKKCDKYSSGLRQRNHLFKKINNPIANSEIISLGTLNATLMAMFQAQLNGYSTITKNVVGKIVDLPQWFGLLSHIKLINKLLVFWFSPLTFS